jgi:hypothetical protein
MEGHAKTYTIPHPAQPRDRFFNSSPVRALEPIFPPLGAPHESARFVSWEGSSSSHGPFFRRASKSERGALSHLCRRKAVCGGDQNHARLSMGQIVKF